MLSNFNTISDKYKLSIKDKVLLVDVFGSWTIKDIDYVASKFHVDLESMDYSSVEYNFSKLNNLDTAGAFILCQALKGNIGGKCEWEIYGSDKAYYTLMELVIGSTSFFINDKKRRWYDILSNIGKATERFFNEFVETLAFLGQFFMVFSNFILRPHKVRWKSVVSLIEEIGLNAVPIVITLCFFVGAVIAYMGVNLLAAFGASIFMVDLVGISVLRELAPIIVAVLVAGRSNSAFTAQIGAMKMRQEIDALKVIGLDAYETLVFPRALACIIALPILTFLGMISGIFSGMLIAWMTMDISPILFLARLSESVGIESFWVGLVKTPFFAIVIAIIGCRQGLAVSGSVESLGSRTTQSVVQSIFAVITLNAIFAILFYQMGV